MAGFGEGLGNDHAGAWPPSRRPPVAILKDAIVISAVVGGKGAKQADTLTAFRSLDRGKTWTRAGIINDVTESAREGLHAMAAAPDGRKADLQHSSRWKTGECWRRGRRALHRSQAPRAIAMSLGDVR